MPFFSILCVIMCLVNSFCPQSVLNYSGDSIVFIQQPPDCVYVYVQMVIIMEFGLVLLKPSQSPRV